MTALQQNLDNHSGDAARPEAPGRPAVIWLASAALAGAVTLPLARDGWLLLLDWTPGPHMQVVRSFWGLDGGLVGNLPFHLVSVGAARLVGAAVGWLPVALATAAAFLSMCRLVGGPLSRQVPAGLLYAVNPVVYERLFVGHVAYLLAYALLPLAVASILRAVRSDRLADQCRPALWAAVLIGLAPHFLWILALVSLAAAHRRPLTTARRLLPLAAGTLGTSVYFVLPLVGRPAPVEVGLGDLAAFRTSADPVLGLFGNVAGLYGFWRQEPQLPKGDVPGWPFLLAAILVVVAAGALRGWRSPGLRPLVGTVVVAGAFGYLLALGDQGPTGALFRWMFLHLPGFAVMREPQKFVALVALAYAALFGLGAERAVSGASDRRARLAAGAIAVALPLAYTPTLFFGLAGRISVSDYPPSWAETDRLMGAGTGKVLFLPWHQYMGFPFTGRTVANPADAAFRREVIMGDNVELPTVPTASRSPRSAYLEFLYRNGGDLCSFGDLIAPLGVEYVVLARTLDWERFGWLDRQVDLTKVLDRPEVVVYRNVRHRGLGWRSDSSGTVEDWGRVLELSRSGELSRRALVVERPAPGAVPAGQPPCPPAEEVDQPGDEVVRRSPVAYGVAAGEPATVVVSEPYDPAWRLEGARPVQLAGGVTGLPAGGQAGTAQFVHWRRVRLGYTASLATFVALAALSLARKKRPRSEQLLTKVAAATRILSDWGRTKS